jgi:hypothetical protein
LETLLESKKLELPKFDPNDPVSIEIWQQVSEEYAKQASGIVKVILGKTVSERSTWLTRELPALIENSKVDRIIAIDPATLKETILK